MNALLVGVYHDPKTDGNSFSSFGKRLDKSLTDQFETTTNTLGPLKLNKTRIFYDLKDETNDERWAIVSFVGLGDRNAEFCKRDDLYLNRENIKRAIATGIESIRKTCGKVSKIVVDDCDGNHELVGLTVGLISYNYKDYVDQSRVLDGDKLPKKQTGETGLTFEFDRLCADEEELYKRGLKLASLQNVSRLLSETPANLCTPSRLAEFAQEFATKNGVQIIVHDAAWAEKMKMGSFLSVARGSCEEPRFIELHYKHPHCEDQKPIVFVGKGITFDSGGISLKKAANMDSQRADMTGAACVLGTIVGAAKLKLKGHFIGIMCCAENMLGATATKPGDVVFAMNGKSIQVNNTDAEGRLVLADGLCYADTFKPELVIDIATLTGAARTAIGQSASVVFSTSDDYYAKLQKAGQLTGQRVWRFPLYSDYLSKTSNSVLADMVNQSKDSSGGSACIAAAFLSQFTKCSNWIHMDIAPTKTISNDYMSKGMSGGPVLSLLAFAESFCGAPADAAGNRNL